MPTAGDGPRSCIITAMAALLMLLRYAAADDQPRFEVVASPLTAGGAGRVGALERNAGQESFVSRIFGTDCYTDALRAVRTECRNLDHEGKTRLALAFANCHLYKLGKRTYKCSASMPLKACVNHKDPEFYFAHMQFFSEIDSMCLFVQNQDFQRHTEFVLNLLHSAGSAAAQRLVSLNASMAAHASALDTVGGQLTAVARQQAHLAVSVNDSLASLDTLHGAAGSLDTKLQQTLEQQGALAHRQAAMLDGLAELEAQEQKVLAATSALHQLARDGATEFVQQQRAQSLVQRAMLQDLREVADSSKGVAAALQAVAYYQRRSDAVLVHLLGRSYGASDVLFYVAGAAAAAAAGAAPLTRAARLPLLGLFGGSLFAERCLPPRLHSLLRVGDKGQVLLRLPLPEWLPSVPPAGLAMDFKWLLRRLCLALGVTATVCAAITFRNVEKENLRSLQRIEAHQRAQAKASAALRRDLREVLLRERRAVLEGVAALLHGCGVAGLPDRLLTHQSLEDDAASGSEELSSSTQRTRSRPPLQQRPANSWAAADMPAARNRQLRLEAAAGSGRPAAAFLAEVARPAARQPADAAAPEPGQSRQRSRALSPGPAAPPPKRSRQADDGTNPAAASAQPGAADGGSSPAKRSRVGAAALAAESDKAAPTRSGTAGKRARREASDVSGGAAPKRSPKRQHH